MRRDDSILAILDELETSAFSSARRRSQSARGRSASPRQAEGTCKSLMRLRCPSSSVVACRAREERVEQAGDFGGFELPEPTQQ